MLHLFFHLYQIHIPVEPLGHMVQADGRRARGVISSQGVYGSEGGGWRLCRTMVVYILRM